MDKQGGVMTPRKWVICKGYRPEARGAPEGNARGK